MKSVVQILKNYSSKKFHCSKLSFLKKEVDFNIDELKMPVEALQEYLETIEEQIMSDDVVLFLKGSRYIPECGYSEGMVYLIDKYPLLYKTYDVNTDLNYKEALKIYSDWPTIPQLYVEGELIGGYAIAKEMDDSGELIGILPIDDEFEI